MFSEFRIHVNSGENVITAFVDFPENEPTAVFDWTGPTTSALTDILLLISIFTRRDVFEVDLKYDKNEHGISTADPRLYIGGGILRTSIPYRGQPVEPEPNKYDIGFEDGLNAIYSLIRSKEWQREYHDGYFLILARSAFRRQPLDAMFIQCWTIWEHLFAILNDNWLSEKQIISLSSSEKISYLLVRYALRNKISRKEHERIKELAEIRNRLIHYGRFPDKGSVVDNAILFTRLTEFIIAKILGLSPSNLFNTFEQLESFLTEETTGKPA
jgi:hypothetical protein